MTVNNFRKTCERDEVVTLAKSLIKNWKKLLPGALQSHTEEHKQIHCSLAWHSLALDDLAFEQLYSYLMYLCIYLTYVCFSKCVLHGFGKFHLTKYKINLLICHIHGDVQ